MATLVACMILGVVYMFAHDVADKISERGERKRAE